MNNPILLVKNAGFGKTPVPNDALLQPGAELNVHDENDGTEKPAKVIAVVPGGVPPEYAIADQNGEPRPLMITSNHYETTNYIIELDGRRITVSQSTMLKGLTAACPECLGKGEANDAKCDTCNGTGIHRPSDDQ